MKSRFSISLRLTIWFSAVFLAGFLIFGFVMWADLAYSLSQGRDRTIGNRARRLQELLVNSQNDSVERRAAKFRDFTDATPEGQLIQVFDSQGQRVYPPPSVPAAAFPWPEFLAHPNRLSNVWNAGREYRVLSRVVRLDAATLRILVAGQLEDNRVLLHRFALGLLWATPVLIVLSALCGYLLSRRALLPVDRLTASARSISIGNLSRRLPIVQTGDELQRLAETCNEMLARLEVAVNQITRFTADASHELRSPISYIRTVAEYALRRPGNAAENAESFREIVQEAEQASRLLEDMLTLARTDAGHAATAFGPVDLGQIVEEACSRMRPLAEGKRHTLSVSNPVAGVVSVTGDAPSLRRLLWILLDNAVKYTPAGGRIEVALETEATQVRISVRDSGVGIPEAALPHIFDRFYRVDSSRGWEEGTGLGLAIAKWIAEVHHAPIQVRSAEGKGTTFQVLFQRFA